MICCIENSEFHTKEGIKMNQKQYGKEMLLSVPLTGPGGSVVEHPLREQEAVGSNPGRAIPKALKMVTMATLLGAQHYKASTSFSSHKYRTTNIATLTKKMPEKKSDNNVCITGGPYGRLAVMLNMLSSLNIEIIIIIIIQLKLKNV